MKPGVPIYVGTDAGGNLPHGLVVDEMLALHAAGLSNARRARRGVVESAAVARPDLASQKARPPTSSSTTTIPVQTWACCEIPGTSSSAALSFVEAGRSLRSTSQR